MVIVLGSGNSGAGAVHDFLLSREDFQSPFNGKEFRLVNDPDGIDELYCSFYDNFSVNGCANKINNFLTFTNNYYFSNYNKKNKILNKSFIKLSKEFIKNISYIEYNGSPQFFFDKISFLKKINFYFKRFILNKNSKEIELIKMIMPCSRNQFLYYSENYIKKIFRSNYNFDEKKNIVIEQGGNFLNPISSTKYYGKQRKIIVVTRNPKAIYWSMKRRNSLSYPGNDVKIFVKWYKEFITKINKEEFRGVINIKFENFFENFETETKILSNKLNIDINIKNTFNLDYTLKNLYKYKDNLSSEEISYIDNNLNEYY